MIMSDGEIRPVDADLSRFVDAVEVDVEGFGDYHELRRKLRKPCDSSTQMPLSLRS